MNNKATLPHLVDNIVTPSMIDEFAVIRLDTGEHYYTHVTDWNDRHWREITNATLGFIRVLKQTRISRDRHPISHLSMKRTTLRTPSGRARGGGVA